MASTVRTARLYVGNLPWTVGHRQLREYFAQFGPVQSARVVFDRSTGLSKGYGFIEFVSSSSAADVNNKHQHILEGLNLTVQMQDYPDSDFSEDDLSPLDISFNEATNHVRKITGKLDNNKLLELYGLYKQGTEGRCETSKPSWYDGKGRKKWEAWNKLENMPSDQAKEKYIILVHKYDPEWTSESPTSNFGTKDLWVAVSSLRYSPEPDLVHNELSLLEAARENCGDRVRQLLKRNPEICNDRDENGLTALHWATDRDATDALKAALEGGCPVDTVDNSGQTALHYAASCGYVESTKILILAGASSIKDEDGQTPLNLAENEEIKKMLEGLKE